MQHASFVDLERLWMVAVLLGVAGCSVDKAVNVRPGSGAVASPSTSAANASAGRSGEADVGGSSASAKPRADGESCTSNKECDSRHCDQGLCCSSGRCCKADTDCGDGAGATCEDSAKCQGARGTSACVRNRCRVQDGNDDDSACDAKVEADDCGFYLSAFCNGRAEQQPPTCATACADDSNCDENARCRDGECIEAEPNGGACMVASDCASRHCSQGVCCEDGDCCTRDSDCPSSYSQPATCTTPADCQGTRGTASCVDSMCQTTPVDDDSACGPRVLAHDCTPLDVYCTGAVSQRASRNCDTNCRWDADCPSNQHCSEFTCIEDLPDGSECDRPTICASGYCGGNFGQPRFCCKEGACCATDENCIGRFVCDDRAECQGTRYQQACNDDFICEDVRDGEVEANDSGCVGQTASTCGSNRDVLCSLAPDQRRPRCPGGPNGRCANAGECDPWLECRDGACQTPEAMRSN